MDDVGQKRIPSRQDIIIVEQQIFRAVIYKLQCEFSVGGKEAKSSFARNLSRGTIETHSLWGTRARTARCAAERWKPN
jgi:hypothetical protein